MMGALAKPVHPTLDTMPQRAIGTDKRYVLTRTCPDDDRDPIVCKRSNSVGALLEDIVSDYGTHRIWDRETDMLMVVEY